MTAHAIVERSIGGGDALARAACFRLICSQRHFIGLPWPNRSSSFSTTRNRSTCTRPKRSRTSPARRSAMHAEFMLCLTGGSTPAATYELLAERFRLSVDWKEVQFFWGDERCVPPDDPASNFAMANRTMLSRLDLRPESDPSDARRRSARRGRARLRGRVASVLRNRRGRISALQPDAARARR